MSQLRIGQSAIARFVIASGILCFPALRSSEAISRCAPYKIGVKHSSAAEYKSLAALTEEFSFSIQNFKMNHQGDIHNLNIKVRYRYKVGIADNAYPDFLPIANDIQYFLKSYPNETAYWEIVNKKLTLVVLNKYPVLSNITIEMQVPPSRLIPYHRSSIVTRHRS